MDSKNKAKELVQSFLPNVYCYVGSGMLTNDYDKNIALDYAKNCANITVIELINETTAIWEIIGDDLITYPEFWIDVSYQINLLTYEDFKK